MASPRSPEAGTRCTVVMPLAARRGGAESSLMELVHHGGDLGFSLEVVFLEDGPMVAECEAAGVPAAVVLSGRLREVQNYARSVARLAASVKRDRPDVVVGWMTKAQLYSGPAARLAGVPAVWCQHGLPSSRDALDRVAIALPARGVVAVSGAVRAAQRALRPRRRGGGGAPGGHPPGRRPAPRPPPAAAPARFGVPSRGPLGGLVPGVQGGEGG